MSDIKGPFWRAAAEYSIITVNIRIMVVGIYFFRFLDHLAFRGVTGSSTVVSGISRQSASDFTFIVNISLPVLGFILLDEGFGVKTVYASAVISINPSLLERICPLSRPLIIESLLELLFVIFLPTVGTAILFNLGAFSGGTDIIAMILRKYASPNIGTVLTSVDVVAVASSFFIFGPETGLFSTVGLAARSLVIDDVIENLDLYKCFNTTYDDPDPICDHIISMLHRSATVYHAQGVSTHHKKVVVMTTTKHNQALRLRGYIRTIEPTASTLISNSSEITGRGLLAG